MKKGIAFVILAAATVAGRAEVKWQATVHDFGAFSEEMGPVTHSFSFVNEGTEPVSILAARPSCGCATPAFDREPVQPGDTASVTVSYNPAGRPGKFSKFVGVELSDGSRSKLYVKGTVVGSEGSVAARFPIGLGFGLKMQKDILMFGQIHKGHMRTASLDLYNRSDKELRPSASCPPHITAVFQPATILPGEMGTVLFSFDSAKEPQYGLVNDTVYMSADPLSSVLVPLTTVASVNEDFSGLSAEELEKAPKAVLGEQSLDFGKISGGKPVTRTVLLTNTGKKKLTVRRVYTADAGVSVSVNRKEIKPGKSAEIKATVNPSALRGKLLNARVSVITNSPESPSLSLRLVGTVE